LKVQDSIMIEIWLV